MAQWESPVMTKGNVNASRISTVRDVPNVVKGSISSHSVKVIIVHFKNLLSPAFV